MIKKIVKAAVVLLIFALQPEILAQTTWHNPEEAGFHVLQGRRYNGEARERFYHRFPAKAKEGGLEPVSRCRRRKHRLHDGRKRNNGALYRKQETCDATHAGNWSDRSRPVYN